MFKKLVSLVGLGLLPATVACSVAVDSEEGSPESSSTGTASEALTGSRPLLVVLMKRADGKALGHTWSWYNDRIFGVAGGRNLVAYYSALSGNRFTFSRASMLSVKDPETNEFDARAGITAEDAKDGARVHAKRARLLAADVGMDYSVYDANGDGTVSQKELTILAIDRYSEGLGATRDVGCLNVSGVKVCGEVSLAGHRSGLMNYAHELAHTLSPDPIDIYGASDNSSPPIAPCYAQNMALQSCTASKLANDSTAAYFMDPWHRGARIGWMSLSRTVLLSNVSSGSEVLPAVGIGETGLNESLELVGPNSESIILEFRSVGANEYEDGLAASGVIAWYRQAKSNGEPADIPSIQPNTTRLDKALFTLAPVNCKLNPNSTLSRGKTAALTPGSYRWVWRNGVDSGFLITITPGILAYNVSWTRTSAAPAC